MTVKLHVNIDHVATLRQARGTNYPDPVQAAELAEEAGAHGITVHLREDRRHIQDGDVEALRDRVSTLLNLEMAATEEMLAFARRVRPDLVTLVPERREERTTEGGLDLRLPAVVDAVGRLAQAELPVSLFIDPDEAMIRRAAELGVRTVELHTGDFANATPAAMPSELARLSAGARLGAELDLRVAAGHGLTVENTPRLLAAAPEVEEVNIGHALVSDAVFTGLERAVRAFLAVLK